MQNSSQPKKRKMTERPSKYVDKAYGSEIFNDENIKATQQKTTALLNETRIAKKIDDKDLFLFTIKKNNPLPNNRELITYEDVDKRSGNITLYSIPDGIGYNDERKTLFLMRQFDGFSCSGATILTCTAGYTKVTPEKVMFAVNKLNSSANQWAVIKENVDDDGVKTFFSKDFTGLLSVEGMATLVYDTIGILPCIVCGYVAQEVAPGVVQQIDANENIFQDIRFQKMMRRMKFAGICIPAELHWYSIVAIPNGEGVEDTSYLVFDSMNTQDSPFFPNYRSLKKNFLLPLGLRSEWQPLTLCVYPVLLTQKDADKKSARMMELIIEKSFEQRVSSDTPYVYWSVLAEIVDQIEK